MGLTAALRSTSDQQFEAWSRREEPAIEKVAEDVWAIPVPVRRIPIRFTYAYLIRTGGGDVVIDPGAASPEGEQALAEGLVSCGASADRLTGLVITHYHFDHWEAADALARRSGAWIGLGTAEQAWVDLLTDDDVSGASASARFREHGAPADQADEFARLEDYRHTREHAYPDLLLEDGALLPLESESLRVLWTPGHSPGHICIHDDRRNLLFSGDHVLPRITPHVALNPFGPPDPLGAYLDSLAVVEPLDGVDVLPAHEYRFHGLSARVDELREDISHRLSEVDAVLRTHPDASAWDVASVLTWSRAWTDFVPEAQRMALVETAALLAHLRLR